MKQNLFLLWLDDIRDPFDGWLEEYAPEFKDKLDYVFWVTNYDEFTEWITKNGLPYMIAFDHDLGDDIARERVINGMSKRQARKLKRETKSGLVCAKWLVDYCKHKDLNIPKFVIQSANSEGKENIKNILKK